MPGGGERGAEDARLDGAGEEPFVVEGAGAVAAPGAIAPWRAPAIRPAMAMPIPACMKSPMALPPELPAAATMASAAATCW